MGDGLRQQAGGAERGPPAPLCRRLELGADAPALAGEGRGVASIKDIARLAGVSVSTVSRVLSDHWLVGEATRAKLKGAIAATNYRPNTICELSDPTLTTVTQPFEDMCRRVVELIAGMRAGQRLCEQRVVLAPGIIARESSAEPPRASRRTGRPRQRRKAPPPEATALSGSPGDAGSGAPRPARVPAASGAPTSSTGGE